MKLWSRISELSRRFFGANVALSKRVEKWFPQSRVRLEAIFNADFGKYACGLNQPVIVDVGGGRSSPVLPSENWSSHPRLIAVDISPDELALNQDTTLKVCADATKGLPFQENTVDIVTSRFLIEHLQDTETFISETARVIRPGGVALHLLAGKYAPFNLLGYVLPAEWSRRLVRMVYPSQVGVLGYTVYYDNCSYGAFRSLLLRHGFERVILQVSYHQSAYAYALFPVFLACACYDAVIHTLGLRGLAASLCVRATQSATVNAEGASEEMPTANKNG